jgi:hypothetical protein
VFTSKACADEPKRVYAGSVVTDGMCTEIAAVYFVPAKTRFSAVKARDTIRFAWEEAANNALPGITFRWSKSPCMERVDFQQVEVRRMCRKRVASYHRDVRFEQLTVDYMLAGGRCD